MLCSKRCGRRSNHEHSMGPLSSHQDVKTTKGETFADKGQTERCRKSEWPLGEQRLAFRVQYFYSMESPYSPNDQNTRAYTLNRKKPKSTPNPQNQNLNLNPQILWNLNTTLNPGPHTRCSPTKYATYIIQYICNVCI